jgi:hypothetical protein
MTIGEKFGVTEIISGLLLATLTLALTSVLSASD